MGLDARKPIFGGLQTTKASAQADQRLFIHVLESIISKLATSEIWIFW